MSDKALKSWKIGAAAAGSAVAAICLLLVLRSHVLQQTQRREDLQRETRVVAAQFASRLQSGLDKHRIAVTQVANFFEHDEGVSHEEFMAFAGETSDLTPLCHRMVVVGSSYRIQWVFPPEQGPGLVGYDITQHRAGMETILRARNTRRVTLSPPLKLVDGADGFVLASPIHKEGRFEGAVVCSFVTDEFFAAALLPELLAHYEPQVRDSGMPLYPKAGKPPAEDLGATEAIEVGGRTWEITLTPSGQVLAALSSGQTAFWTMGCLLILGAGVAAFLATDRIVGARRRLKSQDAALEQTRQRLDGAMQHLMQTEKLSALGELVAGVAHEINNPLSAILGYTQLALMRDDVNEIRRRLGTVVSEAERAGRIVHNLLAFARKQPPEKRLLGLNGIVEKTLELKAYHFRVNQILLEKDLCADLPKTMLDFQQIQQVILNLLNNAEQAILEAGRGGTIRVVTRRADDAIEMKVSDDGPGMTEETQRRIFEPFFTTKQDGKGTGLGLSMCYGIVQGHNGSIDVVSRPGKGAVFCVKLPIVEEMPAAPGDAMASTEGGASKSRIFVVDSEREVLGLIVEMLSSYGYAVDTASDMPEALRKIDAGRYDAIIADLKLHGGTGADIHRAVAVKDPDLARRILFTTGDGTSPDTQAFLRKTGNPLLLKPFSVETLTTMVSLTLRLQSESARL